MIEVEQTSVVPDGWGFHVRVTDAAGQTEHQVTLSRADHQRLAGESATPKVLVEKAFEFLLSREPKDAILRQFDLGVVIRYFPDFEAELKRRLPS
jgi:hypothetical protein